MRRMSYVIQAGLVAGVVLLLGGGYWFYRVQEQHLKQRVEAEVGAVAQLKADDIQAWRRERLADGAVLAESLSIARGVQKFLQEEGGIPLPAMQKRISSLQREGYSDVLVLDRQGRVRWRLNAANISPHENARSSVEQALKSKQSVLTDLHQGAGGLPHIAVATPIFVGSDNQAEPLGALLLICDAHRFLYPLLKNWPTASKTAETLLVRRDGDSVLFLNDLLQKPGAALTLRLPLSRVDSPAVQAVTGTTGVVYGRDYVEHPVVTAIVSVPDTPWMLIAKMDVSEAFGAWRMEAVLIIGFVLSLLALVILSTLALWQRHQQSQRHALYLAEEERRMSEQRLLALMQTAMDGVWLSDMQGRILQANKTYCAMSGYAESELLEMCIFDVEAVETPEDTALRIRQVTEQGHARFESRHRRKDGSVFDLEIAVQFQSESGGHMISFLRDITERKQTERLQRFLAQTVALGGKEDFFYALARYLAETLEMDYICIDRLEEGNLAAQTLAVFFDGKFEDNVSYTLKDTPCGDVVENTVCCIPQGVCGLFPKDEVLQEMNAESYAGALLRSSQGRPIGLIALISRRPLHRPELVESLLRVVALRAGGELERRLAEEALRESEQRFRRAVKEAPYPIMIHAEDGEVLTLSRAWIDITGYQKSDIPTIADWAERAYGARKEDVLPIIERLYLLENRAEEGEFTIICKDGTLRVWDFSSTMLGRLPDGRRMVISMASDITRRKEVEEALRDSNAYLENLFNYANAPIIVWDPSFHITRFNHAFELLTGRSEAEVLGQLLEILFPPALADASMSLIHRTVTGEHWETVEIKILHKNGEVRTVLWNSATLFSPDGSAPLATIAQGQDVTELRRAEQEQLAYEQQLRSLAAQVTAEGEHERQQLAAYLHDDIGQELGLIKITLGEARMAAGDGPAAAAIERAREVATRAIASTRSMTVELSPPALYEIGLSAALEDLADTVRGHHKLPVSFTEEGEPEEVSNTLRSILYAGARELLLNVSKHARASTSGIILRWRADGCEIIVEDNGIGFDWIGGPPRGAQDHGFGLFSIRERLRYAGGRLRVERRPGGGSRVTLCGPRERTP